MRGALETENGKRNRLQGSDTLQLGYVGQWWRLLSNPSSLLSQLMRHKYYINSSFLEAKVGNNASWAYIGIIANC